MKLLKSLIQQKLLKFPEWLEGRDSFKNFKMQNCLQLCQFCSMSLTTPVTTISCSVYIY